MLGFDALGVLALGEVGLPAVVAVGLAETAAASELANVTVQSTVSIAETANAAAIADSTAQSTVAVVETASAADLADSAIQPADIAVVSEPAAAIDAVDAAVQPAVQIVFGGTYRLERPPLVEGIGYALLPPLEGEAHGVVVAASTGAGILRSFVAVAGGSAGAAGCSAARLVIRAAAAGDRGQSGVAAAGLDVLRAAGSGTAAVRGEGSGVIANIEAAAIGRCDDDEAAIAWLLAA